MGLFDECVPGWRVGTGFGLICLSAVLFAVRVRRDEGWLAIFAYLLFSVGSLTWLTGHTDCDEYGNRKYTQHFQHNSVIIAGNCQAHVREQ